MEVVNSKNDVPIRLTDERWLHITEEHNELAGYYFDVLETISDAEAIYEGREGECIAIKSLEKDKKYMIVVYKREVKKMDLLSLHFLQKE